MKKAYMNWSGGKDSSIALYDILQEGKYAVDTLLTNVNTAHERISMHGVRRSLLMAQSSSLQIPLQTIDLPEQPSMTAYETLMKAKCSTLVNEGYRYSIFGDIFLQDLREYRESSLRPIGIEAVFPLWKQPTGELVQRFIALGFKAVVVCVNEQYLDQSFCGRLIDTAFIADLPPKVDPCGENGEFHSFVFDGPIFKEPVSFELGELIYKTYPAPLISQNNDDHQEPAPTSYGFWFQDLY